MVLHQNFVPDPENPGVKPPTALLASEGGVSIQFTSGTIKDEDAERLRRMLFRVTRGKALVHFSAPFTQDRVQRVVYLVVFQDGNVLRDRVNKVCDSFMGSRYEFQDLGDPLFAEAARVRVQILEDRQLLRLSKQQLQEYLRSINGKCDKDHPSQLEIFHHFVAKEKALAACCNMMVRREN